MHLVRLLLMLLALLLPASALGAEPADYQGAYRLDDLAAAEAARDEAVESVVAMMPYLFRGIARGRLTRAATVTLFFRFEPQGERITIVSDRSSGWASDLVATEVAVASKGGQSLHLSRWMDEGALNSRARTVKGERFSLFALTEGGSRLTVTTTIHNRYLPKSLVYRSQYSRQEPEPASPPSPAQSASEPGTPPPPVSDPD